MSIRLCEASGLLQVAFSRSIQRQDIDKNWGEIDKKYWTELRGDLTLEADR